MHYYKSIQIGLAKNSQFKLNPKISPLKHSRKLKKKKKQYNFDTTATATTQQHHKTNNEAIYIPQLSIYSSFVFSFEFSITICGCAQRFS